MNVNTIVIGSLNTDLVATGIAQFPKPGEHVYGKELQIGPGGKSRNIADMIARLVPNNSVAMVGRTVRDPFDLWRLPIDALTTSGVNTDYVSILDFQKANKLPGIALIPVDVNGNNQIFVLPGVSDDFSPEDIDRAAPLFEKAAVNKGMLVLTMECPLATAVYAVQRANKSGLKVMFDPGGIQTNQNLSQLIQAGIHFIKPNEHEAHMLTGVRVTDFQTAKTAAAKLHNQGIDRVLITHGLHGAYLFSDNESVHIPIPNLGTTDQRDETGCGDQTMAVLCASLQASMPIKQAAELAIRAGTLQFYRSGIQPLTKEDLVIE